jgi:hypothetical protein
MGWLTKIAQAALKIVGVVTGFAPIIQGAVAGTSAASTVNSITDDFTKLGGVVTSVETIAQSLQGDASVEDKVKAALPLVSQVIQASELLTGKKIADESAYQTALTQITTGVFTLLNAIEEK